MPLDAPTGKAQVAGVDASPRMKRHLAAIVFADVAGFSRLLAREETETLRRWKALRTQILEPHTAQHGGRIADMAGDAVLVEFPSVVNALRWAIDVQQAVRSGRGDPGGDPGLSLRIGINVEDVIDDDGVLQGDGVVIAARIHQAAEPGQIVVTAQVRDYVAHRMPVVLRDLGTPPLKNIDRPIRVFAVEGADATPGETARQPYLSWATRPTVAVLPFRNVGGTEADSYFGEGITEDIITGLSQSRAFYVIARTSTLRYRDRVKDVRQIAGELDVRYVLDGSVRRWGSRLRISAELIDVRSNRPIWADRYDGGGEDLFDFQDRIVASIAGSLEPRLQAAEAARLRGRPTESLDAYDCLLKAISRLYLFTDESFRETETLLARAIALDPGYAQAHAYVAWRYNFWVGEGRSTDPDGDKARALQAAQRAIELDPGDAFALTVAGHLASFFAGRTDEALEMLESALKINENSAFTWALTAMTLAYQGRPDEALDHLRNSWRLSPFDPLDFYFWTLAGIAEFVAGRYSEAAAWLRKSRRANPRFSANLRMLAVSLSLLGDDAGARAIGAELLAVDPSFRISSFIARYPLKRPEDLERLRAGLRTTGLPE